VIAATGDRMDALIIQNFTRSNVQFDLRKDGELVSKIDLQSDGTARYNPPNPTIGVIPRTQYQIDASIVQVNPDGSKTVVPVGQTLATFGDDVSVTQNAAGAYVLRVSPQASVGGAADGAGAAAAVPCYVTGTAILTARGSVAVEALAVGDVVVTAAGAHRPIRWIGRRGYDGLSAPRADRPVRVRAGALGDGVPARDLRVSPDHALMVEGLFVAAGHLVNGTSITRGEPVADLTYWHVELDSHDLLVAEGAPAESFLPAAGLRGRFADAQAGALADAQADGQAGAGARAAPEPYAPRVAPGPALAALRARLNARAGLAAAMPGPGALRGSLDLCELRGGDLRVAGWARDAAHAAGPVCLDIVVDGAVAATVLAEVARPDLVAAGEGGGRHGFDVGLGMAELGGLLAPGRPHTVAVRRTADRAPLGLMRLDAAGLWSPAQVA
jgi:hypothetical protein